MASFTTRVELHRANGEDYLSLHQKMRAAGFSTTIKGDNGLTYQMPPAEYRYEGYSTAEQVRQKAHGVAATVKANPAVFVTKGAVCAWSGLEQVYAAA